MPFSYQFGSEIRSDTKTKPCRLLHRMVCQVLQGWKWPEGLNIDCLTLVINRSHLPANVIFVAAD